jgi:hypothetical protein
VAKELPCQNKDMSLEGIDDKGYVASAEKKSVCFLSAKIERLTSAVRQEGEFSILMFY